MFKIPDWGDDVPKSNIDVKKLFPGKSKPNGKQNQAKVQNNKRSKNEIKIKGKLNPTTVAGKITKTKNVKQPKYKAKKFVNVSPKTPKSAKKTENKVAPSYNVDLQNCDTDKLDEVLLDAKKKNLVDSYKKDDNEEELFSESTEKKPEKSNTLQKNKTSDNNITHSKTLKKEKTNKRKLKKQVIQSKITNNNIESTKCNPDAVARKQRNVKNSSKSKETNKIINEGNSNNKNINIQESSVTNGDVKSTRADHKKGLLKNLLQNHRNTIDVTKSGDKLRERMLEKLNAAKFRFLNEKLYTSSGQDAQKLFQEDPAAFQTYHQGYQQQVKKWPVNPLDVVVKRIKNLPKTHLVADLGCGEAALSKRVVQTVRSFDLVATAPGVEVCDMAHTPLLSGSMDVAVYCLALMGTDLTQYLVEANRFLKMGGHLLIAEVESRFDDVDSFTKEVQKLGFTLRKLDKTHKVFYFMEFTKAREAPAKKSKLPSLHLKPCIYKRR